jgi:hypothetical protein
VEFGIITSLAVSADTFVVLDRPLGEGDRVVVLNTSHFTSSGAAPPVVKRVEGLPPGHRPWFVRSTGAEWVVHTSRTVREEISGNLRMRTNESFHLLAPGTGSVASAFFEQTLSFPIAEPGSGVRVMPPFRYNRWPGVGSRGIYVTDTSTRAVTLYSTRAQALARFPVVESPVSVSALLFSSVLQDRASLGIDTSYSRLVAPPPYFPSVSRLVVSREGRLAILRKDLQRRPWHDTDSVVVQVLSSTGEVIGNAVLPPRFELKDFDGSRLYGLLPDPALVTPARGPGTVRLDGNRVMVVALDVPASRSH